MPLVDRLVMNEDGFDLYGPKEALVFNSPIIDIECDGRFLRCDIAVKHMR